MAKGTLAWHDALPTWYFRRFRSSLRSVPALGARTWGAHPHLACRVVQPALLPQMARTSKTRATRPASATMNVTSAPRFEGCFTITPALDQEQRRTLKRYLRRAEGRDRCPWRVSYDGASLISRDKYAFGSVYDLWLAAVERWLASHGQVLGDFVRFYGEDPGRPNGHHDRRTFSCRSDDRGGGGQTVRSPTTKSPARNGTEPSKLASPANLRLLSQCIARSRGLFVKIAKAGTG